MNQQIKNQIIEKAVKLAQEDGLKTGFKIGQTVAHPNDPITYELDWYDTKIVVCHYKEEQRRFPRNEVFDPNVALRYARAIKFEMQEECLKNAGLN